MPEEQNTFWSDEKIEGIKPLKIEKIDTGTTKKVKVGTKQQYKQVDGSWSDDFNENSVVSTVNSKGKRFYKRAGENYTHRGNYGSVWRTVDVYKDQPVYRGRYLYRNEDKPQPKIVTSKPTYKVNTKIPIPDKYKEGLVKIEDGLTFYEFPGYTSEQVLAAISGLYGNSIPEQTQMYEDYLKPKTEESDLPTNSNTDNTSSLLQTLEQTSNNVNNVNNINNTSGSSGSSESNDSIFSRVGNKVKNLISNSVKSFTNKLNLTEIETKPLGKRSYAYPYKETFLYAIDPEVSLEVLTKLQELGKGNLNDLKKPYLLAEKPLTNQQPGTTINDTIYTFVNNGGILYDELPRLNMDSKDTLSYTAYFIDPNEITNNTVYISELTYDNAWEPIRHYSIWNEDFAKLTRKNDFLKYVNVINKKGPFHKVLAEQDDYRYEDFTFLENNIPKKHQDFREKLYKEKRKRLGIISKRQSK